MTDKVILKILDVEKHFENVNVLQNLNMEAAGEEIVCIVGPSGCGKTTILNIVSGLTPLSGGKVINNSQNTSYVFQEDRLLPWRDVYQNIQVVNKRNPHEYIMELIEKVGLKGFEGFYPNELSGGMRQRCSIARAFNYEADLLLMDEPFKSLDYNLRIGMIRYLLTLWNSTEKTIIFVTHEIDEALLLGDRIILLSDRPTKVNREFHLKKPKGERSLTDHDLVEARNEIIRIMHDNNGQNL